MKKVKWIEGLRGLGVYMTLLANAISYSFANAPIFKTLTNVLFCSGLTLMCLVSIFCICYNYRSLSSPFEMVRFIVFRFARIAPIFFVCAGIYLSLNNLGFQIYQYPPTIYIEAYCFFWIVYLILNVLFLSKRSFITPIEFTDNSANRNVLVKFFSSNAMQFVGEISYSLFLMQYIVIGLNIFPHHYIQPEFAYITSFFMIMTLTTMSAYGSYNLIEKPCMDFIKNLYNKTVWAYGISKSTSRHS